MVIGACWYLAGAFLTSSLVASVITVVPGREILAIGIIASCAISAILFAAAAIYLHNRKWRWIRQSKLARNLFLGFAALITLCLLPLILG
jgi:hypothetical protein